MGRGERAKAKHSGMRGSKNKASNVSHNIDENCEEETLSGHLKQESLPYRMSGTEYSKSTTQRETLGKDEILFGYN